MATTLKLTPEEQSIVTAIRELRAAERRHQKGAERLREHGEVTLAQAAKLLGVRRAELKALLGTKLPLTENGSLPVSELRRYVERRAAAELHSLHVRVAALFRPASWARWFIFGEEQHWGRRSLGAAAEELGITEREVRHLVDADELFAVRVGRGALTISGEEIAAFKAARAAKRLQLGATLMAGSPSTPPVIRRQVERNAA